MLLFFAFGPLVSLLIGEPVYRGIVVEYLDRASTGFTLSLAGLAVADRVLPRRREFVSGGPSSSRTYELLPVVLLGLVGYGLWALITKAPAMLGADKIERLGLAGRWHYPYLLVETFAMATYFIARRFDLSRVLYWANAAIFVGYCLATTERDCLFLAFALTIQAQLFRTGRRSRRTVVVSVLGLALAVVIDAVRQGVTVDVARTLNQGSLPFVDTYVMSLVPAYWPHLHGLTYQNGLLALLPDVLHTPSVRLDQWLVELYAPGWGGGYGFSLSAEAYLNFGLAGIPVVFVLLGLAVRFMVNRSDRSDWWAYTSVVLLTASFSAVRGDSAQLVATMVYGTVFFVVISALSTRGAHARSASTRVGSPDRFEKVWPAGGAPVAVPTTPTPHPPSQA